MEGSPGHICPVHRCTRRCAAPCEARLIGEKVQRRLCTWQLRDITGKAPPAAGTKRGPSRRHQRRGRPQIQPSDPGPGNASIPAASPLTSARGLPPFHNLTPPLPAEANTMAVPEQNSPTFVHLSSFPVLQDPGSIGCVGGRAPPSSPVEE